MSASERDGSLLLLLPTGRNLLEMKKFRILVPVVALMVSAFPSGCGSSDGQDVQVSNEGTVTATTAEEAKPAKPDDKFNRFISKD
jgi:hypothetical protein